MASPGIRSYQIARVLAENLPGARVTLMAPAWSDVASLEPPFRLVPYTTRSLVSAVRENDIVISSRIPFNLIPRIYSKRVVLDLFTPYFTEWMEISTVERRVAHRNAFFASYERDLIVQLMLADFILCATARQRDLYFGMLNSMGRVTLELYENDRGLSNLLALAPYGVRPGEPKATRRVLRGVRPGIREEDTILIWNGGIIEWYDLATLIRAVHRLSLEREDIKLFFLGTEHPDTQYASKLHGLGGGTTRSAIRLCEELDILDRFVFFNVDWVDYDETANYLLEANIGVCTYFDNLETRYAFRSRFLDLLWAELPIICTEGDVLAGPIASRPLGITVPERDGGALVDAIRRLADDQAFIRTCQANLQQEKEKYRWERVLKPLVEYCGRPADLPLKKGGRLLPLAGSLASSLEAKVRHGLFQRLDSIQGRLSRSSVPRSR